MDPGERVVGGDEGRVCMVWGGRVGTDLGGKDCRRGVKQAKTDPGERFFGDHGVRMERSLKLKSRRILHSEKSCFKSGGNLT